MLLKAIVWQLWSPYQIFKCDFDIAKTLHTAQQVFVFAAWNIDGNGCLLIWTFPLSSENVTHQFCQRTNSGVSDENIQMKPSNLLWTPARGPFGVKHDTLPPSAGLSLQMNISCQIMACFSLSSAQSRLRGSLEELLILELIGRRSKSLSTAVNMTPTLQITSYQKSLGIICIKRYSINRFRSGNLHLKCTAMLLTWWWRN